MERIKVVYSQNQEIVFEAPDGAYNDIVRLLLPADRPDYVSGVDGSPYKFCVSLKDIVFIGLEKADTKEQNRGKVGF